MDIIKENIDKIVAAFEVIRKIPNFKKYCCQTKEFDYKLNNNCNKDECKYCNTYIRETGEVTYFYNIKYSENTYRIILIAFLELPEILQKNIPYFINFMNAHTDEKYVYDIDYEGLVIIINCSLLPQEIELLKNNDYIKYKLLSPFSRIFELVKNVVTAKKSQNELINSTLH